MKNIKFTTDGKRFDLNSAERLGGVSNIDRDDTRGATLYKTASGNYILRHWSRWQGESDSWEIITKEKARNLALKYWTAEEATVEFPEVRELEDEV